MFDESTLLYQMVNLEPNRGDAVKGAKWGDPSSEVDDTFRSSEWALIVVAVSAVGELDFAEP